MKKLFLTSLLLIFFLSACGSNPTPTPTSAPPTGVPPTALPPTAVSASPTPTPSTTAPSNTPGCTDAAAFVADVTVPDYDHFSPRETFTKTWRVKNIGTCTWTSAYTAVYSSGDRIGGPLSVPLGTTAPGTTLDISVKMSAPALDGTYKVYYQLHNAADLPITIDDGDTMWTIITVGKTVVYSAPPTATSSSSSSGGTASGAGTGGCVTQSNAEFVNQTLALINNARAANSLPALTFNNQLAAAAQAHSVDMACSGSLSHTGSDGSTPATRIAASGYSASITRENIYAQPPQYGGNPQSAMDWWMNSQLHRDAILNAQVKEIGVGYAAYAPSPLGGYFTVVFAAP